MKLKVEKSTKTHRVHPAKYIQCYFYTLHGYQSHKQSSGAIARAPCISPSLSYPKIPEFRDSTFRPLVIPLLQSLAGSSLNTHSGLGRPSPWFNYCLARVCTSSPTRARLEHRFAADVYRVLEKLMTCGKKNFYTGKRPFAIRLSLNFYGDVKIVRLLSSKDVYKMKALPKEFYYIICTSDVN